MGIHLRITLFVNFPELPFKTLLNNSLIHLIAPLNMPSSNINSGVHPNRFCNSFVQFGADNNQSNNIELGPYEHQNSSIFAEHYPDTV